MLIKGGCLCGAVRYQSSEAPITTRTCWCRDCQYLAAGSATVNLIFHNAALTIDGPLQTFSSPAASGTLMHRAFCPACGTPISSRAETRPHLVVIRAGTLDDPSFARPSATIWTSSAPKYACIDPTLPQVPHQPPPAA